MNLGETVVFNSLVGRQRIREAITLAHNKQYAEATKLVEELSQNPAVARGAMVYLIHLLLAAGGVMYKDDADFSRFIAHVFRVSAEDEVSKGFL